MELHLRLARHSEILKGVHIPEDILDFSIDYDEVPQQFIVKMLATFYAAKSFADLRKSKNN